MSDDIILKCENLKKSYFKDRVEVKVLKQINLEIKRGEMLAIIGSSGAGKSTLLHILGTLEKPTAGTVTYNEKNVFAMGDNALSEFRNRHFGFIFQFHYLLPEFTALENVQMPALIAGYHRGEITSGARDLLRLVGLDNRLSHRPGELSGGEQQRVAIARALMMRPEIVFADELTGNLDSENSENIYRLLIDINQRMGTTFIVVSHDMKLATKLKRIIKMTDGNLENG